MMKDEHETRCKLRHPRFQPSNAQKLKRIREVENRKEKIEKSTLEAGSVNLHHLNHHLLKKNRKEKTYAHASHTKSPYSKYGNVWTSRLYLKMLMTHKVFHFRR